MKLLSIQVNANISLQNHKHGENCPYNNEEEAAFGSWDYLAARAEAGTPALRSSCGGV